MIGHDAQQASSALPPDKMHPGEIALANARHSPRGFIVVPLPNGNFGIFDRWWRYIGRDLVGAQPDPGLWDYEFWPGELSRVLMTLAAQYEFKPPAEYGLAARREAAGATKSTKSAEELGL